jgi:PAS domain S-box-containing protein
MIEVIVILVSIIFQVTAVALAIYLIKVTERYFAWIVIAIAILLMAIRRIITLITIFQGTVQSSSLTLAEFTALIISILFSLGLYFMIPIFKSIKRNQLELDAKNVLLQTAKDKAQQSEAFLENLFDNIPSMIFIKEAKGLRFVRVNKAAELLMGYERRDIIGRNDYDLFPKEQADFFISKDKEVLTGDGYLVVEEEAINTKKGTRILFTRKIALKDRDGNNQYLMGISEDVTEKIANEKALVVAKEKAEESDKLKSAFLQNMSHEIRTPLNAICGFSEKINSPNITPEKRKQYSKFIVDNSLQLLSVVTDILTISALETGQEKIFKTDVNINSLLDELLATFNFHIKKSKVKLLVGSRLPSELATLKTDRNKLYQILANLLGNAVKFTQNGSVEFGCVPKNKMLEFYVKDTGIGIDKGSLQVIFRRFAQADMSIQHTYGGTGLGLSISKGLVELMGGDIWLESEVGVGSTFYFTLPFLHADGIENIPQEGNLNNELFDGFKILVAEDEEFNLIYLSELLTERNCVVVTAINGRQAVDACREDDCIDLVLMDIRMPIMDGLTAAKLIKKIRPNLPVVAQTAYALEHEVAVYSKAFNDYLTKPVKVRQIVDVLNKYLSAQ